MISKPILFSGPMVRAILEGRKTQTRRLITFPPSTGAFVCIGQEDGSWWPYVSVDGESTQDQNGDERPMNCPHPVGSEMWVRETWSELDPGELPHRVFLYRADGDPCVGDFRWSPSIFMPRAASRITLKVTDVRVQRLQDISEEDAKAEGLKCLSKDGGQVWKWGIPDSDGQPGNDDHGWHWHRWSTSPVEAYRTLWESINGPGSWAANPYVWKYVFEVKK